jgi:two-component system, OmpR family, sensor kinase
LRINSVRTRLILWNVGVLSLVLAVFGAAVRHTYEAKLAAGVDQELAHRAHLPIGGRMLIGGPPPWGPAPGPGLPALDQFPPVAGKRRPDERRGTREAGRREWRPGEWERRRAERGGPGEPGPGERFMPPWGAFAFGPRLLDTAARSRFGPASEGPWDPHAFTLALRGDIIWSTTEALNQPVRVLSVPVFENELRPAGGREANAKVVGVVQHVFRLTGVYEELGRLTRTLLTLFPLALLAAALGGALLTDRALRPVRNVTRAAAQIGASDLSERLPVKGKDEFAELAATFNGMLGRLEQAFTHLAQALERQQRFTADASHELRTPLTIIKANTSLALEEERSPVEYRRALEAADHAADTTNRIVQDLLLLARGDVGQLRVDPHPIRIGDVLERAAAAFRDPQRPSIAVELSDPSLTAPADPDHLLRLFGNLLENAVRHTPKTGSITVSADAEGDGLVARVRDTGEGIPPEHLPHVCERFYRVDAARTRRQGGTGLGLAICQSIVEAHHGSLALESVVGEGTTVTVRLPACLRQEHEARSTEREAPIFA